MKNYKTNWPFFFGLYSFLESLIACLFLYYGKPTAAVVSIILSGVAGLIAGLAAKKKTAKAGDKE